MNYPDYLCVDCETSGATNGTYGNAFTDSNRLCYIGIGNTSGGHGFGIDIRGLPFGGTIRQIDEEIRTNNRVFVGFNCKFDLHWLRRYGVKLPKSLLVWDCQLAEFIICNQQHPLPSLEDTIEKYCLGEKYTLIEDEYWNKGIDTQDIPIEIVLARVESDVVITSKLFEWQIDYLRDKPKLKKLIWLCCQDQLVLEEMEFNGLAYNIDLSLQLGEGIKKEQQEIKEQLYKLVPDQNINWGSNDHLSAVLFGGNLCYDVKEDYIFTYKSGLTKPKQKWVHYEVPMPRRVDPISGSELKKAGFFSASAPNLKKLKPKDEETKQIIQLNQRYAKLDKQVGTYYFGIPKLYKDMEWVNNLIHGQLQSATTITGRLSSVRPNQQNMDRKVRQCLITRF